MDRNRPIPAGSRVEYRGHDGRYYEVNISRDWTNPDAERIRRVIRYGPPGTPQPPPPALMTPVQQPVPSTVPPTFSQPATAPAPSARQQSVSAHAAMMGLLNSTAGNNTTLPAPPSVTPSTTLPPNPYATLLPFGQPMAAPTPPVQQHARPTRTSMPAAPTPSPATLAMPPPPPPAQIPPSSDSSSAYPPLKKACHWCHGKKKGCTGKIKRPCGRCIKAGRSAAECVTENPDTGSGPSTSKRSGGGGGGAGAGDRVKGGRIDKASRFGQTSSNGTAGSSGRSFSTGGKGYSFNQQGDQAEENQQSEDDDQDIVLGRPDIPSYTTGPLPRYHAADGVSAVAGRGIHVPVKPQSKGRGDADNY